MSIRPHPTHPGWYIVDYYPEGRSGKRERVPFPSWTEAAEYGASIKTPASSGPQLTHPRIQDVVDEYLQWVKLNLSPTSYGNKERRFRLHITPALGRYRAKELSHRTLESYRRQHTRSQGANDMAHLAALIRWMIRNDYAQPLAWKIEMNAG